MDDPVLKSTPNNPAPEGGIVETIVTRDRVRLRTLRWPPTGGLGPGGKPQGTVCLFQGRTEFIEKYYETIADLRRRGFAVATLDWRGQGLSERPLKNRFRGHIRTFGHYRRDLEAFLHKVAAHCPAPYFALGHSMGAHILFAQSNGGLARFFDRMVLTAPMLHLAPRMLCGFHWLRPGRNAVSYKIVSQRLTRWTSGLLRFAGFGWAYVAGGSGAIVHPFKDNILTSDEVRFSGTNEFLAAHPELGLGSPTNAWLNAACRSMRRVLRPKFLHDVDVPLLIVASGADQVVSTAVIEKITPALRTGHTIVIRNARHEILFERDELREQFWAAFDAFIPGSPLPRKK